MMLAVFEKPYDSFRFSMDAGELQSMRSGWNATGGVLGYKTSGMVRHNGSGIAFAADGHSTILKMPPYQVGSPAPASLGEIGDTRTVVGLWPAGAGVELYMRDLNTQNGF